MTELPQAKRRGRPPQGASGMDTWFRRFIWAMSLHPWWAWLLLPIAWPMYLVGIWVSFYRQPFRIRVGWQRPAWTRRRGNLLDFRP